MEKQLARRLSPRRLIAGTIVACVLLGTAGFLWFLATTLSRTIGASASIMTLQGQVVRESLHRSRLLEIGERLKEKTERPPLDPKKIQDPF